MFVTSAADPKLSYSEKAGRPHCILEEILIRRITEFDQLPPVGDTKRWIALQRAIAPVTGQLAVAYQVRRCRNHAAEWIGVGHRQREVEGGLVVVQVEV